MSINLLNNQRSMLDAYDRVLRDESCSKWAIFTYEDGNSNTLKLESEGEGGIDAIGDEFRSGRIEYGIVTVQCNVTKQPKQGENVGTTRLGMCASHVNEVKRFFKGVSVTHYARNEDDVEPAALRRTMEKVTAALDYDRSAAVVESPPTGGVGSVYKRTMPSTDKNMQHDAREQFWKQMELEERARQKEEQERMREKVEALELDQKRLSEDIHQKLQQSTPTHQPSHTAAATAAPAQTASGAVRNARAQFEQIATTTQSPTISKTRPVPDVVKQQPQIDDVNGNVPEVEQNSAAPEPVPVAEIPPPPAPAKHSLSAHVIWDYEAVEEGELTLTIGTIIKDIDKIDDGWWMGTDARGQRGLFPANYVQLN